MGARVSVSIATNNVYQKVRTAVIGPTSVPNGTTFTAYSAAGAAAIPRLQSSAIGDVTVNTASKFVAISPIPAGMTYVSSKLIGGDAKTAGKATVTFCPTFTTPGCTASTSTNFSPRRCRSSRSDFRQHPRQRRNVGHDADHRIDAEGHRSRRNDLQLLVDGVPDVAGGHRPARRRTRPPTSSATRRRVRTRASPHPRRRHRSSGRSRSPDRLRTTHSRRPGSPDGGSGRWRSMADDGPRPGSDQVKMIRPMTPAITTIATSTVMIMPRPLPAPRRVGSAENGCMTSSSCSWRSVRSTASFPPSGGVDDPCASCPTSPCAGL